ncbi:hypothetical protein AKJ40_02330 [candidate division MSBL1 archaeon SCGC-AAA259M10]|uniref:Uncharacterized protein n=1 Tax=candidate division MSBL1 archaeon SCGC-AAA259M10 TaxID=1698270 RepID=A0A133V0A2_9EURY|nr:hypothetical protein AKJ40_02330 [candidate division MSBL1 archaeon SCGC-AAA259M10]
MINILLGIWILFGSYLSFGSIEHEIGIGVLEEIERNFWAVKSFMNTVMMPAAVGQILTGIALMIIGTEY